MIEIGFNGAPAPVGLPASLRNIQPRRKWIYLYICCSYGVGRS